MSKPFFIDAHCHLSEPEPFSGAGEWIKRAHENNVRHILLGGVEPPEWENQKKLHASHPETILTSFGIHPWWIESKSREVLDQELKCLEIEAPHAQAIGETGLDFHSKRNPERFADQEYFFRAQIALALRFGKPLVLHIVSAHEQALQIVRETGASDLPMLIHSFSGSAEVAKQWVKLGAFLSFSGTILWKDRHEKVKKALTQTPLENLLFETDSPHQAWREDGRNESALVTDVYSGAAALLGVDLVELQTKVAENFVKFTA